MEITLEKQKEMLALNDEQKALLAEWKELAERMEKAELLFFIDEEYNSIGVANGERIKEVCVDPEYFNDEYHTTIEDEAIDWNAFNLPNLTTYYGDGWQPYAEFDGGKEIRNLMESMESAAL